MRFKEKSYQILNELKNHAPFTLAGAVIGLGFMILFRDIKSEHARIMFGIFHPAHVFLSAMVTASVYTIHYQKKKFIKILLVGYFGSIGVATLSDSVVPYIGEKLFSLDVPTHSHEHGELHSEDGMTENETALHEHEEESMDEHIADMNHEGEEHEGLHDEHEQHSGHGLHLGFLEEWYIVHPVAILGVILAWFIPKSKCPHAAHVLISTWASSAYILMSCNMEMTPSVMGQIFGILFIAVWLPCCISDIIFPMVFADSELAKSGLCACHSHKHSDESNKDE